MPDAPRCPQCRKIVPADAPHGLCPACTLPLGRDSVAAEQPTMPPAPDADAATLPPAPASVSAYHAAGAVKSVTAPALDAPLLPAHAPAIPGYEIIRELGRGGMGVVYQARHIQLGRPVALKMLLAGSHAGAADIARFRTEAEAMARLEHPNIVQIHDIGEHEGKLYFSLEYCTGGSLADRLDGTPWRAPDAARIVATLADAIDTAHQRGVIHRDLKPANVLLLGDGTPKITDFGLAKKLDDVGQTQSGAIMGTPSYMPPEQASGAVRQLGPSADIYALGAILYELLTGRAPFKAATPLDTILQVVADEPVPPARLQRQTPRDLETICLKCLQKDPRKRYASAEALAEDLRRFAEGRPIAARPVGRIERLTKWVKRHPVTALLLAAVAVLAVVAFAGITSGLSWALLEREHALEQEKKARDEKVVADTQRDRAAAALEVNRRSAFTLQLAFASFVHEQDPVRALELLGAQNVVGEPMRESPGCPRDLRDFSWGLLHHRANRNTTRIASAGILDCMAFTPDGATLVTAGGIDVGIAGRAIGHWDPKTGQNRQSFAIQPGKKPGAPQAARITPDAGTVVSVHDCALPDGGRFHGIKVWDTVTGKSPDELPMASGAHDGVVVSADGKQLAVASVRTLPRQNDGVRIETVVRLWNRMTRKERVILQENYRPVEFAPDGKMLALVSTDPQKPRGILLWDVDAGRQIAAWMPHKPVVSHVAFAPDGKSLATACGYRDADRSIRLWDLTGQLLNTIAGHPDAVVSLAFSPDGQTLASAGLDRTVRLWDPRTGQERLILREYWPAVCMAFAADSRTLAVHYGGGGAIRLWDIAPQRGRRSWPAHASAIWGLAVSADGATLVTRGLDGKAILWNLADGAPRQTFAHMGAVRSVPISPDHRWVVTTNPNLIHVWNAADGKLHTTFAGHNSGVAALAFSPDGTTLHGPVRTKRRCQPSAFP